MLGKTFKFTSLQITKNRCELSAMISEYFEITCLKWLKHHTCAPIKPSENFIFFSSLIFVSVSLTLTSKEVKCYQKWLKNGVKSEFNPNFNDTFIYICSSFLNKTAQLIHLAIDLSRLHKNLNSGKLSRKCGFICIITIIDL